ncbi:MAG TPA: valine--tRNA ligase [Cyclobacteriaceae bacterium]|jgi:valyl-tRNA synthetase
MSVSTKYDPAKVEDKWYKVWLENGYFSSTPNPDKEPYCIVIPPPNVTGVLHMGHMLNNTIQDILVRKARMEGKEALWVPGTDHASIATEAKVVAMLKEQGISKKDISRKEFVEKAWEWTHKYGGIILEQLKKLGASCDWSRTRFTMEDDLSKMVIMTFIDLYNKGYIYRGYRMVNWDPIGKTALADDEVNHRDVNSKLYYIKYKIENSQNEFITIATTRPETILGDTAVCINPADERYKNLAGKRALVPLINRSIPIIDDDYVTMEFGTGCLKVTPAHDVNDYELGKKHKLETVDILNDDGSLNKSAQLFVGKDRFEARELIVNQLEKEGHLVKTEAYVSSIGFSERTDAIIEPRLSMQWFVRMNDLVKPALENVMNDEIKLYPPKFKNLYRHWMENVRDWCISRQLWWGHQIPAYYYTDNEFVVAETPGKALELAQEKTGNTKLKPSDLKQDPDVLDTWFSSGLWPISVFNGLLDPQNNDIKYYYPTNDLVTAPEILFFWVARMIIFGYEYKGEPPFRNVYLTGIVRDKLGRKMSKSLGNSPDPIELIKKYSADGVRTGMLFSSPAGNDLLFDIKLCEQGRNFANKIWNAFRLVSGWNVDNDGFSTPNQIAIDWMNSRFNQSLEELESHFRKFRISDALLTVYKLVWDDFASWYLEMIKPEYGKPIDSQTKQETIRILENILKILHPYMPFITEEIWDQLGERDNKSRIIISPWPAGGKIDQQIINKANHSFDLITAIRKARNSRGISLKESFTLQLLNGDSQVGEFEIFIKKLANVSSFEKIPKSDSDGISLVVNNVDYFIPLTGKVDKESEKKTLLVELKYAKGFLESVNKKLSNERFVNNAPESVVEVEKKKKADTESKIRSLEESLSRLN